MAEKKENKNGWGGARRGTGPKPIADRNKVNDIRVMVRITKPMHEKLSEKSRSQNLTVSNYLRNLIKQDLEK